MGRMAQFLWNIDERRLLLRRKTYLNRPLEAFHHRTVSYCITQVSRSSSSGIRSIWTRTFSRLTLFWHSATRRRGNFLSILGCISVWGVGWELYGHCRCSVLAITGVYKFLFPKKKYWSALQKIHVSFVSYSARSCDPLYSVVYRLVCPTKAKPHLVVHVFPCPLESWLFELHKTGLRNLPKDFHRTTAISSYI